MSQPVVAICTPIARHVPPAALRSRLSIDLPRPYHYFDMVSHSVEHARNLLTEIVLNEEAVTHLLWIDDDAVFAPDAARRLLAHDLPIVGGLCFGRRHPYFPTLMQFTERGFAWMYDYPEGLVEVGATGAHFLLTKKEVYFDIFKRFPEAPWTNLGLGEDVAFHQRAGAVGIKTFVDTTVKIGHLGEVVIDEAFAQRHRTGKLNPFA